MISQKDHDKRRIAAIQDAQLTIIDNLMSEIKDKDNLIASLEKAIIDANSWLVGGEGISLLYYRDHAEPEEVESLNLIKDILAR